MIGKIATPPHVQSSMNYFKITSFHSRMDSSSSPSHPAAYQQQVLKSSYRHQINRARRSKSMDDFATQLVIEQNSRVQTNNIKNPSIYHHSSVSQLGNRNKTSNMHFRANNHQSQQKNQIRYSVDNLLEIDTSYYNNYQVKMEINDMIIIILNVSKIN